MRSTGTQRTIAGRVGARLDLRVAARLTNEGGEQQPESRYPEAQKERVRAQAGELPAPHETGSQVSSPRWRINPWSILRSVRASSMPTPPRIRLLSMVLT